MRSLKYAEGMSARTVDWTARGEETGSLRERKKRQLRQQLTDTATEMFFERGFDGVRVAEIAEACGVSEKTVYNHFPTKESLILDHPDATIEALRTGLADPGQTPVEAALIILAAELAALVSWLDSHADPATAIGQMRRFSALIQSTPALRTHQREMTERLIAVAAEILADRAKLSPDDPEPQIAATALLGLWQVQFTALRRYLDGTRTPPQIQQAVTAEVRRAADLITSGLAAFG